MDILRQLQSLSEALGSLVRQIEPLIALFAIVGGAIACFAGRRVGKALLVFTGFLAGASLAAAFTMLITSGNTDAVLIPALIGGLVIGGLSLAAYYAGLFVSGAATGALLAGMLAAIANAPPNTLVVVALAVLGGGAFVFGERLAITLASAFAGAWALVSGISRLAGGDWLDLAAFVREPGAVAFDAAVIFLCWLAVSLLGIGVQTGRLGKVPRAVPSEMLSSRTAQSLLVAGGAAVLGLALCAIIFSARAASVPSIPAPTRSTTPGGILPQSTPAPALTATAGALAGTATAEALTPLTATATLAVIAPTATRAASATPTRDPATYPFRLASGPTVDRARGCVGGYYIFGAVRDPQGQALTGVRIKYGTATFFPPAAVTEAKGYELTVGSADVEWYVRVVDQNDEEQSPVVVVRTQGMQQGNCWIRLDWAKK